MGGQGSGGGRAWGLEGMGPARVGVRGLRGAGGGRGQSGQGEGVARASEGKTTKQMFFTYLEDNYEASLLK